MDAFGRSLSAPSARDEVADAIHQRGAFRSFEKTIRRLGVEEAWFAYKRRAFEDFARNWLAEHGLEIDAAATKQALELAPR
jgi:hypothetical protein